MKFDFKSIIPQIGIVVLFLLISTIYFLPQTQGKKLRQSDTVQFRAFASEALEYREKGENILWTNSIFSGMPTYQISSKSKTNLIRYVEKIAQLKINAPIGLFFSGLVICYLAFLIIGIDKWLALFGSVLYTFNPNNLVLFEAGHQSKIRAVLFSILIIVGVIKLFKKKYLLGGLTFALGLALSLGANHFQMTYYVGLTLLIFGIIGGIQYLIEKDIPALGKIVGIGLLATIVAAGTSSSKLWTTYEYTKTTMRGEPVLEPIENAPKTMSSSETKGLNWDYANQWSNGIIDVMGIYIPGVAGGGSNEPVSANGPTNKFMKKNRLKKLDYGPMYWGKLPFTSGPAYMGATGIFLFIMSLFVLKGRLRYWGLAAFLFTIMISMGKNLEWFNRIIFDYLPFFNKFRAPSSITSVTAAVVTLIGLIGTNQILNSAKEELNIKRLTKYLLISTGILSVISLFYGIMGPGFFDFEAAGDVRYAQNPGLADAFQEERASIMRRDSFRSLFFVLGSAGVLYFFLKGKLSKLLTIILLGALIFIDIFPVNMRYVNYDSFLNKRKVQQNIQKRAVDDQILQDTDPYYRVHDASLGNQLEPFQNASTSNFHKTLGGYHAAKLQRFEDVKDLHLLKGNQAVFNMFNTKYFILGTPGNEEVKRNGGALGNAWFVNDIKVANTHREEINGLTTLDPSKTAIIHSEFSDVVSQTNTYSSNGTIRLTSYHPEKLVYSSNNSAEGLAVFSEVWYGPNLGWKLYIDGKETDLIRANYILRAAIIPIGDHELVMEFDPKSYKFGEILGLIFSLLIIGGSIYLIYKNLNQSQKE